MKAIVNVDKNWGIGSDNNLLFPIPADMKFFKEKTIGNVIVMGRKTLDSFPGGRPLVDRVNIVLTNDKDFQREGVHVVHSVEELMLELERYGKAAIYVVGGASVYELLLPYCDTAYVTKVNAEKEADKFFPNLDNDENWMCVRESEINEHNGIEYKFTKYKNIQD